MAIRKRVPRKQCFQGSTFYFVIVYECTYLLTCLCSPLGHSVIHRFSWAVACVYIFFSPCLYSMKIYEGETWSTQSASIISTFSKTIVFLAISRTGPHHFQTIQRCCHFYYCMPMLSRSLTVFFSICFAAISWCLRCRYICCRTTGDRLRRRT